jgi:hypothetical protein
MEGLVIQLRTDQVRPVDWLDERIYCKYARADDIEGAGSCPQLNARPRYCRLNGAERADLCVFDLPETDEVWQRTRESVAEYKRQGWSE